jgi:hypothetical protein
MRIICLIILCLLIPSSAHAERLHHVPSAPMEEPLHPASNWIDSDKVILRGLDKISARVFTSEVFVNQKIHFGSLEIYVRSASRSPPEDQPESLCFLEIYDNKPGQQRQKVFSGWMFSSNPALSALEHPVYDIWVKETVLPGQPAEPTAEPIPAEVKPDTQLVDVKLESKSKAKSDDDDDDDDDDVIQTKDKPDDDSPGD